MSHLHGIRLLVALPVFLAALLPVRIVAQDDPNDAPLGDVARSLRKKGPTTENVIDDDNLPRVMQQAESRHSPGSALKFMMAGESKGFQVSAPDVTCSLSFTADAKSLLSSEYAQMDLPSIDMQKLQGPATIEGDALLVSVFNGTDWHVSEVAVALTVVKKNAGADESLNFAAQETMPAANEPAESEVRPEKKPDQTVIYRMRAAAAPSATTVFSSPLGLNLEPGAEWHWAIVQAKGYPPRNSGREAPQTAAQNKEPERTVVPSSLLEPMDSSAASLSQDPH